MVVQLCSALYARLFHWCYTRPSSLSERRAPIAISTKAAALRTSLIGIQRSLNREAIAAKCMLDTYRRLHPDSLTILTYSSCVCNEFSRCERRPDRGDRPTWYNRAVLSSAIWLGCGGLLSTATARLTVRDCALPMKAIGTGGVEEQEH